MKSILGLVSAIIIYPLSAQEPDFEYGIVGLSTSYKTGVFSTNDKPDIGITANLFYNSEQGFIDGSLLNYNVLPYIGMSANWRFAEVSNTVSDIPEGIDDREGNPELGITIGTAATRITYLHDVAGIHKGQEIQAHLGKTLNTPINNFLVTPFIEVNWRDENLSQHLYGISTEESSRSGLAHFNAGSSLLYKAGVVGLYEVTKDWVIISQLRLEKHNSASALIQRDIGWATEIGLVYKFSGN